MFVLMTLCRQHWHMADPEAAPADACSYAQPAEARAPPRKRWRLRKLMLDESQVSLLQLSGSIHRTLVASRNIDV